MPYFESKTGLGVDRCGMFVFGMGVGSEVELGLERSGMWGFVLGLCWVLMGWVVELGRRPPPQGPTMQNPIYIEWGGSASRKHRGGADLSVYVGLGIGYGASLFIFWAHPLAHLSRPLHGCWITCISMHHSVLARASLPHSP